ncbi:MAG: response regulator transcription factor [Acidobacteria bacterium]|nr:response regulator transcription factor [Acidobacteriota bacterium]
MASSRRRSILVIEDDEKIASSIRVYLNHQGFDVEIEHDGRQGLTRAREHRYDLLVLDLMLPGIDGMEICRTLRRESDLPILMLTARTTTEDRVEGLEAGADDYLPKPFSPRELTARIRAVLRRTDSREVVGPSRFRFGVLDLDLERHEVRLNGRPVSLTPTEFDILSVLARAPGRVFTRERLIRKALATDYEGQDRTIDAHVKNLRRKLEADRGGPEYIRTVFGVGYRFDPEEGGGTPDEGE